jgi:hypothetical protein
VDEPLIERGEVVALLFSVSDITRRFCGSNDSCRRTTVKRKRMSDEDRAARERALANSKRLRALAEKAQAELDRRRQQEASA